MHHHTNNHQSLFKRIPDELRRRATIQPPDNIHPACPSGGNWYICASSSTPFIGCCTTNPCLTATSTCPIQDVRPATFDPASYGTFPDQACPAGQGSFYTCTYSHTPGALPFMGCCRSNPCNQNSCPQKDLGIAELAPVVDARQKFLAGVGGQGVITTSVASAPPTGTTGNASGSPIGTGPGSSTTATSSIAGSIGNDTSSSADSSSTTSSSSSTSTDLTIAPLTSISPAATTTRAPGGSNNFGDPFATSTALPATAGGIAKGAVAGIVVSGFVALAGLAGLIFFLCTRRQRMAYNLKKQQQTKRASMDAVSAMAFGGAAGGSGPAATRAYYALQDEMEETPRNSQRLSRLSVIPPVEPIAALAPKRRESRERYGYDDQGEYDNPSSGRYYASPTPPDRTSSYTARSSSNYTPGNAFSNHNSTAYPASVDVFNYAPPGTAYSPPNQQYPIYLADAMQQSLPTQQQYPVYPDRITPPMTSPTIRPVNLETVPETEADEQQYRSSVLLASSPPPPSPRFSRRQSALRYEIVHETYNDERS